MTPLASLKMLRLPQSHCNSGKLPVASATMYARIERGEPPQGQGSEPEPYSSYRPSSASNLRSCQCRSSHSTSFFCYCIASMAAVRILALAALCLASSYAADHQTFAGDACSVSLALQLVVHICLTADSNETRVQ